MPNQEKKKLQEFFPIDFSGKNNILPLRAQLLAREVFLHGANEHEVVTISPHSTLTFIIIFVVVVSTDTIFINQNQQLVSLLL